MSVSKAQRAEWDRMLELLRPIRVELEVDTEPAAQDGSAVMRFINSTSPGRAARRGSP